MCVVLRLVLKAEFCRAVNLNGKVDKEWKRGEPGTHFCLSLSPRLDLPLPWLQVWELKERESSCFSLMNQHTRDKGKLLWGPAPTFVKRMRLLLPFYLATLIWKIPLALPYLEPCGEGDFGKCAPVKLCGHTNLKTSTVLRQLKTLFLPYVFFS